MPDEVEEDACCMLRCLMGLVTDSDPALCSIVSLHPLFVQSVH